MSNNKFTEKQKIKNKLDAWNKLIEIIIEHIEQENKHENKQ